MKKTIRSALVLLVSGSLIASQAFAAAEVVPGYGAAGASNPALAAFPLTPGATDTSTASAGAASTGALDATAAALGVSTTAVVVGGAAIVAAAIAIPVAAASGSSGGSSSSSHH